MKNSKSAICIVDGCEGQAVARQLCSKHYQRVRMYGTFQLPSRRVRAKIRNEQSTVIEKEIKRKEKKPVVIRRRLKKPAINENLEGVFANIDKKLESLKEHVRYVLYAPKSNRSQEIYTLESKAILLERQSWNREKLIDKVARRLVGFGGTSGYDASKGNFQNYINRKIGICLDRMINSTVGYDRPKPERKIGQLDEIKYSLPE